MTNSPRAASSPIILSLLLLSYIFNFLDRQIVSILAIPIKSDLALSDTQLGLLGGIAFAAFYSTFAIPVARLADRTGRARVVSIAIAVWSSFTLLCGLAANFWQLFLARMGVGLGEAGGVAPAYALIADHFAPERRARALAIFSLGIPIGSALGLFFGGWLAETFDWRLAFFAMGLAGLPVAFLVRTYVPDTDPKPSSPSIAAPSLWHTLALLARMPHFWLLSAAAALASICGYGFGFWLPRYLNARLGLSLSEIGEYYGAIVLIGGVAGIFGGGWAADRLAKSCSSDSQPIVPAIAFLIAAPLYAAAFSTGSLSSAWILLVLAYALAQSWLGPLISRVQQLVDPEIRATAAATFLLIVNLVGIGFGTFIFGYLSDAWAPSLGAGALRLALIAGLPCYVVAGLLCVIAARRSLPTPIR